MCNAISKITALAVMAAAAALSSCGPDKEAEAADRLVAQAKGAIDRSDFDSAFIYLDSLSSGYPRQIEAGRRGLALRPAAIAGKTQQEIMELQMLMQDASARVDSLRPRFKAVPPGDDLLEGYYISVDAPDDFRSRNTVIARVTPRGEFVMVSSLAGRTTRHTHIILSSGQESARTGSVAFDASLPLSRESVRFATGSADEVGRFAESIDDGRTATVIFAGGKSEAKARLSAKEVHAIADSWRLSQAMSSLAPMASRLEQLKAKLQLARDQDVNVNKN
ncbi:MAG: hypothetical protein K2G94_01790 [Muribaculaceae bacterium]|nr:hypothetical protein [Muribaculaceae bacterium]MDE6508957.1 hypothetical protein [Muribaculaceae bacterium]